MIRRHALLAAGIAGLFPAVAAAQSDTTVRVTFGGFVDSYYASSGAPSCGVSAAATQSSRTATRPAASPNRARSS
jgi:hypothetical protein